MRWKVLRVALLVMMLGAMAGTAQATLSPEAYQLIRSRAPLSFDGVVLRDLGGRLDVRVEQVLRGPLQPGTVVAVAYPEDRGTPPPPGPAVYYRRFVQGDRLRIWGQGQPVIHITHGGIDLLYRRQAPPSKSGGCGACATSASSSESPIGLAALVGLLALFVRRRRRR